MNWRHHRYLVIIIGVLVVIPLSVVGESTEDIHVLYYHDGTPTSSWPYENAAYWFHMWCTSDGYFDGVVPPGDSGNPMTIQKLDLYHYGEGDFRVRVVLVNATELGSEIVEEIGSFEFSTTCSDCWEDFVLDQYVAWYQVGEAFPGLMTAIIFEPLSIGTDGLPAPRLGVGGCEDDPDGTPHPHPHSSQLGTSDFGSVWHEDTEGDSPCGDYLIDVYWFTEGGVNANSESFSSVKLMY